MIVVVACGAKKRDKPSPAGEMYTGRYHRLMLQYALTLTSSENVYILSAKYGLLALDDVIVPYDLKMGDDDSVARDRVREQAEERGILEEEVTVLGGKRYADICRLVWPECRCPLKGLGGIGKQIAWLVRKTREKGGGSLF